MPTQHCLRSISLLSLTVRHTQLSTIGNRAFLTSLCRNLIALVLTTNPQTPRKLTPKNAEKTNRNMNELALVTKKTCKNPNMNQQARSAVRAAHMSVLITVQHNTIQHKTVLIMCPLILHTIITAHRFL